MKVVVSYLSLSTGNGLISIKRKNIKVDIMYILDNFLLKETFNVRKRLKNIITQFIYSIILL